MAHSTDQNITNFKIRESLTFQLFDILNDKVDIEDSIAAMLNAIKTATDFDAVGIRLQSGDDFPYYIQLGFSKDFLITENSLTVQKSDGSVCRDDNGNICLEGMCGLVLSGKTNPANPLFTEGGSAWTNDSLSILDIPLDQDPRLNPRNKCIHKGYMSVALIPIRNKKNIIGLLQLNDFRKDRFTLEIIKYFEGISSSIGIALSRKRAENELLINETLVKTAIENLPLIFYMIDRDGFFRLSEGAGLKGLGLKPNQVVGQSAFVIYKEFPEITNAIRRSLSGVTVSFESKVSGSSYFNVCVPFSEIKGEFEGIVAVALDITEHVHTEETLQNMQKLESLGVLAGGIAHDFNNLLGGIFGNIDMASEASTDDKVTRYLSKAMNTIDRARALTQQLLTFAKGGAPVQQIGDLFPFVQETAQFALSGANVSCLFNVPKDLWACNFDKNQIGQVIDNLIINAQQAMPVGGTIDLTARNIALEEKELPLLVKGNYIKLTVKDTGVGIPKELISRIFDPFFTTKAKGHGLGLATCYSIITRHGGCIDVNSEPGKGSSFNIYLPASTKSVSSAIKKTAKNHKGSGTFIIMDDEEVMRDAIQNMLETLGYSVVCKENGKETVDFFKTGIKENRTFAGIIFDLTVPGGMGGKEAIEEIRKLDKYIPAFVASGYADDPVMKTPAKYGFTASICKPFRKGELSEMLNKYLKKKK